MSHKLWTDELLTDAQRRVAAGQSVRKIAQEFNGDVSNLYRRLRGRGRRPAIIHGSWAPTLHLPTDKATLGYIAGLVDADGSIMFVKRRYPAWCVRIGMTDEPLMTWLGSLGGTLHKQTVNGAFGTKPIYNWTVARRQDVRLLLTALLPYLRVKHDLAEQALAWCNRP